MVLCCLKRFFDAQRVDKAGYSAVRLEKSIIMLFMYSLFLFGSLFFMTFGVGLVPLAPFLIIFPVYWLILLTGFKGAARRSPRLLLTYFFSKAFFELALLSTLSVMFLFIGVVSVAIGVEQANMDDEYSLEGDEVFAVCDGPDCDESSTGDATFDLPADENVESDRQFATPSGTYTEADPAGDDPDDPAPQAIDDEDVTNDGDMEYDAEDDDEVADTVLIVIPFTVFVFMAGVGLLHFLTTLVSFVLTMRTYVLLRALAVLPVAAQRRTKKSSRKHRRKPSAPSAPAAAKVVPSAPAATPTVFIAPEGGMPHQMYAGAQYQPMVYVVPMPAQQQ